MKKIRTKPPDAIIAGDGDLAICPHCKKSVSIDACDCLGADWGCVFCTDYGNEFCIGEWVPNEDFGDGDTLPDSDVAKLRGEVL